MTASKWGMSKKFSLKTILSSAIWNQSLLLWALCLYQVKMWVNVENAKWIFWVGLSLCRSCSHLDSFSEFHTIRVRVIWWNKSLIVVISLPAVTVFRQTALWNRRCQWEMEEEKNTDVPLVHTNSWVVSSFSLFLFQIQPSQTTRNRDRAVWNQNIIPLNIKLHNFLRLEEHRG